MKRFLCGLSTIVILLFACNNEQSKDNTTGASNDITTTSADRGVHIFQEKCAICHSKTQEMSGPALNGVVTRWENDTVRLKSFIRSSSKMIAAGDPTAVKSFEKYKTTMPDFTSLSDADLNDLLNYLNKK